MFVRSLRRLGSGRRQFLLELGAGAALIALWLTWLFLADVGLYETTGTARLESSGAVHPLEVQVAGRVVRSNLRLGERVRAGEVLVELDDAAPRRLLEEEQSRRESLGAQLEVLRSELATEERVLAEVQKGSSPALAEAEARRREAEASARAAEDEAERARALLARSVASTAEYEQQEVEARKKRALAEAAVAAAVHLGSERRSREAEQRLRIERLRREAAQLEGELAAREAGVRRLSEEVERYRVRAPIDGVVGELREVLAGAVVGAGQRLGGVVPQGELHIVAQFLPTAVGRVRPGQPAIMRVSAFPWTQYGSLLARVTRVATEPLSGHVRVELAIEVAPASIPLQHGLEGTMEVEVGRDTPANVLLQVLGKKVRRGPASLEAGG